MSTSWILPTYRRVAEQRLRWSLSPQPVTPPVGEIVTLTQAKTHLRVDTTDDDTYITGLITTARERIGKAKALSFLNETWNQYFNRWPWEDGFFDLMRVPLVSVGFVNFTDSTGTVAAMATTNYIVDPNVQPGRIVLAFGTSWPGVTLSPASPIQVQFTAGYHASDPTKVPTTIYHAMLMMISHLYENREPVQVGRAITSIELPMTVDQLLSDYGIRGA